MQAHLKANGVETLIHYPVPIPQQPALASEAPADCPIANRDLRRGVLAAAVSLPARGRHRRRRRRAPAFPKTRARRDAHAGAMTGLAWLLVIAWLPGRSSFGSRSPIAIGAPRFQPKSGSSGRCS